MEEAVFSWITQHGYPAIFGLLVLGIIGLPVPDETLLTFVGYLIYTNRDHCQLYPGAHPRDRADLPL